MLTRGRLVALGLWLALAIVVWNSIFDAAVNGAAHRYVIEATEAARSGRPYVSMDAVMRPAIASGAWLATAWGTLTFAIGAASVLWSIRRARRRTISEVMSKES